MGEVDELTTLREEKKKLEQKVSVLEKELQQYEAAGPIGYYYEMNRWINSANEYIKLKAGSIGSLIITDGKDFERVMALIKSTREVIESIGPLKLLLGITDDEAKDKENGRIKGKDFVSSIAEKKVT